MNENEDNEKWNLNFKNILRSYGKAIEWESQKWGKLSKRKKTNKEG